MDDSTCASCGRRIERRGRGGPTKYCSKGCRQHRPGPLDRELEARILAMLDSRAAASTLCPSEVARAVSADAWRPLMERTRRAARRLVAQERVEIRQGGRVVDPSTAKGPIRVGRGRRFEV